MKSTLFFPIGCGGHGIHAQRHTLIHGFVSLRLRQTRHTQGLLTYERSSHAHTRVTIGRVCNEFQKGVFRVSVPSQCGINPCLTSCTGRVHPVYQQLSPNGRTLPMHHHTFFDSRCGKEVIRVYPVTVTDPSGRQLQCGELVVAPDDALVWEAHVHARTHLFDWLDAWTVSVAIVERLKELGADRIRYVVDDRNGEVYEVGLATFVEHAQSLDGVNWRWKTGPTWALPRERWEHYAGKSRQLALFSN